MFGDDAGSMTAQRYGLGFLGEDAPGGIRADQQDTYFFRDSTAATHESHNIAACSWTATGVIGRKAKIFIAASSTDSTGLACEVRRQCLEDNALTNGVLDFR